MKDYADAMAKYCCTSIDTYLGSGDFGEAYLTKSNTVVKITNDPSEVLTALRLKGSQHTFVANVFDCKSMGRGVFAIHLEYLEEHHDAENAWYGLMDIAVNEGVGIEESLQYLDFEDFTENSDIIAMANNLYGAMCEIRNTGSLPMDIRSENMGYKNGHFAVFDSKDKTMSDEYALEVIKSEYPDVFGKKDILVKESSPLMDYCD